MSISTLCLVLCKMSFHLSRESVGLLVELVLPSLWGIVVTHNWALTSHFTSFSCLQFPDVLQQLMLPLLRENNAQVSSGVALDKTLSPREGSSSVWAWSKEFILVCAVPKKFSEKEWGYIFFPRGSYSYLVLVTVCCGFWWNPQHRWFSWRAKIIGLPFAAGSCAHGVARLASLLN